MLAVFHAFNLIQRHLWTSRMAPFNHSLRHMLRIVYLYTACMLVRRNLRWQKLFFQFALFEPQAHQVHSSYPLIPWWLNISCVMWSLCKHQGLRMAYLTMADSHCHADDFSSRSSLLHTTKSNSFMLTSFWRVKPYSAYAVSLWGVVRSYSEWMCFCLGPSAAR